MTSLIKSTFLILITLLTFFVSCKGEENRRQKGTLVMQLSQYPRSLNHYVSGDAYSSLIASFVQESLLSRNENTYELEPSLAKKWEISPDKKTYRFYVDERAKFSDGTPVTAHDLSYTYDVIYNISNVLLQPTRDYMGEMVSWKALSDTLFEVVVKNIHYENLEKLGGISVLHKKLYGAPGKDFNKDFDRMIVGSGPYTCIPSEDRKKITFIKNSNWWGNVLPETAGYYNFPKVVLKVVQADNVSLELFKKQMLDVITISQGHYATWDDTNAIPWSKEGCVRSERDNKYPSSWGGVALNMRKAPLNEKEFRQALQLLLDRELIGEKVYRGKMQPVRGPFIPGSPYSAKLDAIAYNPEKAVALLNKIGYTKTGEDGILYKETKDGKIRASITLMFSHPLHEKWATMLKESAKKVGVEIELKLVEWTAATKLMDEFNFDAFAMGWSGSLSPSPEQLFHGRGAKTKGSSNYPGLDNPLLNALIERGPTEFDEEKRYLIYREIESIIVEEQPYLFLFQPKYILMAYWEEFIAPPSVPFLEYTGSSSSFRFYNRWLPGAKNQIVTD